MSNGYSYYRIHVYVNSIVRWCHMSSITTRAIIAHDQSNTALSYVTCPIVDLHGCIGSPTLCTSDALDYGRLCHLNTCSTMENQHSSSRKATVRQPTDAHSATSQIAPARARCSSMTVGQREASSLASHKCTQDTMMWQTNDMRNE